MQSLLTPEISTNCQRDLYLITSNLWEAQQACNFWKSMLCAECYFSWDDLYIVLLSIICTHITLLQSARKPVWQQLYPNGHGHGRCCGNSKQTTLPWKNFPDIARAGLLTRGAVSVQPQGCAHCDDVFFSMQIHYAIFAWPSYIRIQFMKIYCPSAPLWARAFVCSCICLHVTLSLSLCMCVLEWYIYIKRESVCLYTSKWSQSWINLGSSIFIILPRKKAHTFDYD